MACHDLVDKREADTGALKLCIVMQPLEYLEEFVWQNRGINFATLLDHVSMRFVQPLWDPEWGPILE
jgi:hypothetical protein